MPHDGNWAHVHTEVLDGKVEHYYIPTTFRAGEQRHMPICDPAGQWVDGSELMKRPGPRTTKCKACRKALDDYLARATVEFKAEP